MNNVKLTWLTFSLIRWFWLNISFSWANQLPELTELIEWLTDWIDWTELTRWFLLKLKIRLGWFIWFVANGSERTDARTELHFLSCVPALLDATKNQVLYLRGGTYWEKVEHYPNWSSYINLTSVFLSSNILAPAEGWRWLCLRHNN